MLTSVDVCLDELTAAICAQTHETEQPQISEAAVVDETFSAEDKPGGAGESLGMRRRTRRACNAHVQAVRAAYGKQARIPQNAFSLGQTLYQCFCRAMDSYGLKSCCSKRQTEKENVDVSSIRVEPVEIQSCQNESGDQRRNIFGRELVECENERKEQSCCAKVSLPENINGDQDKRQSCAASPREKCRRTQPTGKETFQLSNIKDSMRRSSSYHGSKSGGYVRKSRYNNDENGSGRRKAVEEGHLTDLEKGMGQKQPLSFSVQGMDCSSCEGKLLKALASIPGICDIRSSFLLSRVDMQHDPRATSAGEISHSIKLQTGYQCQALAATFDKHAVLVRGDPGLDSAACELNGVKHAVAVGNGVYSVAYDPQILGIRQLLECLAPFVPQLEEPEHDQEDQLARKSLIASTLRTLLSIVLTVPILILTWAPIDLSTKTQASVKLALATIVQGFVAAPIYTGAYKSLVYSHIIEMDFLVCISISAAYGFSVVNYPFEILGRPISSSLFETSALLITLIMVGRLITTWVRRRAVRRIDFSLLQNKTALLCAADGTEQSISTSLLEYGDVLKALPSTKFVTDGKVILGTSEADESMLTGEQTPITKHKGSTIVAGTLNGNGVLLYSVTRLLSENSLKGIESLVEGAAAARTHMQELSDAISGYLAPVVLTLAAITFLVHVLVNVYGKGWGSTRGSVDALTYAIAVLSISCPCAIGLAMPLVIVVASGMAADKGILFKTPEVIEFAHKMTHVVFDKTGTLTNGNLTVVRHKVYGHNCKAIILLLLKDSRHSIALSICSFLREQAEGDDVSAAGVQIVGVREVTGKGVEAERDGRLLRGGNPFWSGSEAHPIVRDFLRQGLSVFCLVEDNVLLAAYGMRDTIRPEAQSVVRSLLDRNVKVYIISGDHSESISPIGTALGIPMSNCIGQVLPEGKQKFVQALKSKKSVVVFCGDGTNDAIALVEADIGISMSNSTDIATNAADIAFLRNDLSSIVVLVTLSKRVFQRVWLVFGWALFYNLFAILLAAGALVKVRVTPEYAGLGELVSVLPAIVIAMQMKWQKLPGECSETQISVN